MSAQEINKFIDEQTRYVGTDFLIHLVDTRDEIYFGNEFLALYWRSAEVIRKEPWYPKLAQYEGRTLWIYGPAWRSGKIHAAIGARQLNDWNHFDRLGDLYMVIPFVFLERIIEDVQINSEKIQVFDSLGQIVYSTEQEEIGQKIGAPLLKQFRESPGNIFRWREGEKEAYISYSVSEYSGWTVAAYMDPDTVLKDLEKIRQSSVFIGFFGILAALLLVIFFSRSLVRPIRYLAMRLSRVERGNLLPYKSRMMNREAYILYNSFNNMVRHLDRTIRDLSERRISEKKAQMNALKAQFNPHFLYNTLNTIYWNLVDKGNDHAAGMVLTLSELLRYSIRPGSEQVTVREDLEQLKRFVRLQKERYGDKLRVDIEADPAAMEQKVMKLMLQPLVENAIYHGLDRVKGRPWLIRVRIGIHDRLMTFIVEDNGVGMTEQQKKVVFSPHQNREESLAFHSGLGLANLHQRIRLNYGRQYGIHLSDSEWGGLRVEITLPVGNTESAKDHA